jgi:hypothetical protein
MKFTKYVYWHFKGKIKITGQQKEIEGSLTVTPSAQKPRSEKAMLKYSVRTM